MECRHRVETVLRSFRSDGHIKAAEQRIIMQQYGDWYTGRPLMGELLHLVQRGGACYGPAQSPPRYTNVTAHQRPCTDFIIIIRCGTISTSALWVKMHNPGPESLRDHYFSVVRSSLHLKIAVDLSP